MSTIRLSYRRKNKFRSKHRKRVPFSVNPLSTLTRRTGILLVGKCPKPSVSLEGFTLFEKIKNFGRKRGRGVGRTREPERRALFLPQRKGGMKLWQVYGKP